jgi:hypothetical protein
MKVIQFNYMRYGTDEKPSPSNAWASHKRDGGFVYSFQPYRLSPDFGDTDNHGIPIVIAALSRFI